MEDRRHTRALVWAGAVLMLLGLLQAAGAVYVCWQGGVEGVLSPPAVLVAATPMAALFLFLGFRLRTTAN